MRDEYDFSNAKRGPAIKRTDGSTVKALTETIALLNSGQGADVSPMHVVGVLGRARRDMRQLAQLVTDYQQAAADAMRLIRELDVLLNGEGAAKQASLCDLVAQLRAERDVSP